MTDLQLEGQTKQKLEKFKRQAGIKSAVLSAINYVTTFFGALWKQKKQNTYKNIINIVTLKATEQMTQMGRSFPHTIREVYC